MAFGCLLNISANSAHVGALTDGKTWNFFYILEDRFYQTTIVADNDEHIGLTLGTYPICSFLTLGLLTLFAGGQFPTTNHGDPTWIQVRPSLKENLVAASRG